MDVEYLREFIELAKDGHFTHTAAHLGISQPTLSKHIAAIENEFGIRVFERNNLRTVLTPAGQMLFDDAQGVLVSYETAKRHANDFRRSAPLSVSIELFKGYKPTDDLLATARDSLRNRGQMAVIEAIDIVKPPLEELRQGNVDLGLLVYPRDAPMDGLATRPLVTEPLVAVVSARNKLAQHDVIRTSDLDGNVVWTIQEGGSRQFAAAVEQILADHGAHPNYMPVPWQNAQSSYTNIAFVSSGVFITFASVAKYSMPALHTEHKVLRFADEDGIDITVSAVWNAANSNPGRQIILDEMLAIAGRADMTVYWQ